jgi:hypothetical protein
VKPRPIRNAKNCGDWHVRLVEGTTSETQFQNTLAAHTAACEYKSYCRYKFITTIQEQGVDTASGGKFKKSDFRHPVFLSLDPPDHSMALGKSLGDEPTLGIERTDRRTARN